MVAVAIVAGLLSDCSGYSPSMEGTVAPTNPSPTGVDAEPEQSVVPDLVGLFVPDVRPALHGVQLRTTFRNRPNAVGNLCLSTA